MTAKLSIYVGYDPRELACFAVCRASLRRHLRAPIPVRGLVLDDLRAQGFYTRPTERRDNQLWDTLSNAPMSTEFAISRFLTPILAKSGWALFMDCDIMARENVEHLFERADPSKAVLCVQHQYQPRAELKMDNQIQTRYARKNWSSVMLFNCDHPGTKRLTLEMVNTLPGRDLHRFCWLEDDEIGALPMRWNYLVNHSKLDKEDAPALVHWTEGAPCMPGYEQTEFAEEFRRELVEWAL